MTKNEKTKNVVKILQDRFGVLKNDGYKIYLKSGNSWLGNEFIIHTDDLFELKDVAGASMFFGVDALSHIVCDPNKK